MNEQPHCYQVPQEILNFATEYFQPHDAVEIIDFYQRNKKLPAKVMDDCGNINYPRQLYACLMFKAARDAVNSGARERSAVTA